MTSITACPACQTQFEVTETELQAYGGKVRCGECDHVFDARAYLLADAGVLSESDSASLIADAPSSTTAVTAPVVADVSEVAVASAEAPSLEIAATPDIETTGTGQVVAAHAANIADAIPYTGPVSTSADMEHASADATIAGPIELDLAEIDLTEPTLRIPAGDDTEHTTFSLHTDSAVDTPLPPLEIPEFLRKVAVDGALPAQPRSPLEQRVLLTARLLLLAVLAVQSLYFSRTTLAASYPRMRPMLLALCQPLHCTLNLPADITQLTIDDADMQEHAQREGALVFSSVLINHGTQPQALPAIEITLTNTADQPVIRKRLQPQDYLPAGQDANMGIAPQQELRVNSLLGVNAQQVAGFRVALSY